MVIDALWSLVITNNRVLILPPLQVCCLGAVGFICWLVTAAIAGYWAATADDRKDMGDDGPSYMGWNSAKFAVRGLAAAFLMYLFMKVNARSLPLQNQTTTNNHIIVPIVMLGIFSMFLESLLDQYAGTLESTLRYVAIATILK